MEAEVVTLGHCGECKTAGWMSDDNSPPCDDSYCTGPYRVDDVEVIKTSEIDDHILAQILACEYGKADVSEEYTLDILCLMALADAFDFEYGEFV